MSSPKTSTVGKNINATMSIIAISAPYIKSNSYYQVIKIDY